MPRKGKSSLSARLDVARNKSVTADVVEHTEEALNPNLNGKGVKAREGKKNTRPQSPPLEELEKSVEGCICFREPRTFVCIFCKMFSFGRITEPCSVHPNVTYLMDFTCCPFCSGSAEHLHVVNMEYERYFT